MSRHGRVLVAMSGGVDSSAAALMLHEQGYEVVGVTMKTWDYETSLGGSEAPRGGTKKVSGCCSLDDMNDARAVAVNLGATHLVVDLRDAFGTAVTDRFVSDYLAGRTPNPCVLCNTHVKWGALVRRADALGCAHIATGHYARLDHGSAEGDRVGVRRGLDRAKDQSYVLWGVSQANLARTLLPLGGHTKPEIRALAEAAGLAVARKKDSYEICFVPDDDYRGYLRRRVAGLEARVSGGPFVHAVSGETLGTHAGAPFYTVGQRRGLGLSGAEALYVTAIDAATNTVHVGPRACLAAQSCAADGVVWGAGGGLRRRDARPGAGPRPRPGRAGAGAADRAGYARGRLRGAAAGRRAGAGRRAVRRDGDGPRRRLDRDDGRRRGARGGLRVRRAPDALMSVRRLGAPGQDAPPGRLY